MHKLIWWLPKGTKLFPDRGTSCYFDNFLCIRIGLSQKLMMMSCYALFFRAISELRRLKVLNLAMCTGVTLTGICSLVKSGKNTRYFNNCNVVWLGMYKAVNLKFYKKLMILYIWFWWTIKWFLLSMQCAESVMSYCESLCYLFVAVLSN